MMEELSYPGLGTVVRRRAVRPVRESPSVSCVRKWSRSLVRTTLNRLTVSFSRSAQTERMGWSRTTTVRTVGNVDHPRTSEQIIEELVAYDRHLDEEKARIRPLLLALQGGPAGRTDTTEVLLELFRERPKAVFTAAEAEAEIRKRGWVTESNDPVNAVRAALNRLKNNNEIEIYGRGRYRLVPEDAHDPFIDISDDEGPQTSYDDPWGSDPQPVPVQTGKLEMAGQVRAADDEPPF